MSPIIISGLPRSGTTWMQWFLSQHPRIHIHGQEPKGLNEEDHLVGLSWNDLLQWYKQLIIAGKWGAKSNKSDDVKKYVIPHYAGSSPERCREIFARMTEDFLCGYGPRKPRWGVKSLLLATNQNNINIINSIWPETKWIICLRHPFISFQSQKNTFVKKQNLEIWIENWIATVENTKTNNFICVQIDKLNEEAHLLRRSKINKILGYIGENPTEETEKFIEEWKVVHKVKADKDRIFKLDPKRKDEMLNKFEKINVLMKEMHYA